MEIAEAHKIIEHIMGSAECPKDFECLAPGGDTLCQARSLLDGRLTECLADSRETCMFAVDFGIGCFCECPMRSFLLKTLGV